MSKEDKIRNISYINVPETLKVDFGSFHVDPRRRLPVLRKEDHKHLSEEDITVENIISGMLTIIAYDTTHPDFQYFCDFVRAVQPDTAEELNKAAIAKEQQKDYDFAEELFLAVYHLLPQSASCINLATLYSCMSVDAEERKDDDAAESALANARLTLMDGLSRFGENEHILSELASFEGYMGNLEEAKEYTERYLKVASEGSRKVEMKEFLKKLDLQLGADNSFKEAYDFIMLDMPEKALSSVDKFIAGNPRLWNGYFLKGWALRKLGRYDEAKEALLRCIELGENNGDIYNELSICELETGHAELAKEYLNSAVDLDGYNLKAISNLAFLHLRDNEFDEARYYLEKARNLADDDEIVRNLIDRYEEATGEKIGGRISEEVVDDGSGDDKLLVEEEYLEGSNVSEGETGCDCGHHHEDGHCHCHDHESDGHECTCGHDGCDEKDRG